MLGETQKYSGKQVRASLTVILRLQLNCILLQRTRVRLQLDYIPVQRARVSLTATRRLQLNYTSVQRARKLQLTCIPMQRARVSFNSNMKDKTQQHLGKQVRVSK